MPDPSTPRTLRHQQRHQLLIHLYDLAFARRPDLARLLGTEVAVLLADDAALSDHFAELFDRRPRSSPTNLATSPMLTSVLNAQATVLNAPVSGAGDSRAAGPRSKPRTRSPRRGERSMDSVDSGPPPPTTAAALQSPSDSAHLVVADATDDDADRLCFGAIAAFMWPDGDTASLEPRLRGRTAQVKRLMREALLKRGVTDPEQPEYIATHLTARRWANQLGALPKTIANLEKNWYSVLFGADANGRSNGTVHTAYLNETGTIRHEESFSQIAARRNAR